MCVRWQPHVYGGAARNNVGAEGTKHLGQALQTNRTVTHATIGGQLLCTVRSCDTNGCVRWQPHVYGGAALNNVCAEGTKHLGQALQTNRTVTHVTIGGQLLCIVRGGDANVCVRERERESWKTCASWCREQRCGSRGHDTSGAGLANESHRDTRDDRKLVVVYCTWRRCRCV